MFLKKRDITHDDLKQIMIKPWFIPATTRVIVQMQNFRIEHYHIAFIVDEYGLLQGLLTLEDILEEIVGEILDEHDISEMNKIKSIGNNKYIVYGDVSIRDINKSLDLKLEDKSVTVAGLVLNSLDKIPSIGEKVSQDGIEIKILRMTRNKITLLRIRKLSV